MKKKYFDKILFGPARRAFWTTVQARGEAGSDGAGHGGIPWGTARGEAIFHTSQKYRKVGNPHRAPTIRGHSGVFEGP